MSTAHQRAIAEGFEPLPSPFSDVLVAIYSGAQVTYVSYRGEPRRLVALGVATWAMLRPKRRRGRRIDRHGRHFLRSPRGKNCVELIIYIEPSEADSLPGSSTEKVQAAHAQWEARFGALQAFFASGTERPARRATPSYLRLVVDNTKQDVAP